MNIILVLVLVIITKMSLMAGRCPKEQINSECNQAVDNALSMFCLRICCGIMGVVNIIIII